MDFKRLIIITMICSLVACGSQPIKTPSEEIYFKNFGLAVCLSSSFKVDELTNDLSKAANGYIQRSNMSPEAYDELRSRNKLWQKKSYPSKHGGQVKSARCMDFYRSDELHNLYLKHTPCDSKENWWDNQDYKKSCL